MTTVLALHSAAAVARAHHPRHARSTGAVNVLYAGSLLTTMEHSIAPAFQRATGDRFIGYAEGSRALASEIKAGVVRADVFISASASVNRLLEGQANGRWVRSYVVFGNSPLVIGYNPKSPFAHTMRTTPWTRWVDDPGIHVGRTDPAVDPKGALTVTAIEAAARIYRDPALRSIIASPSNVFPEQVLVGLLQSGQLDAGFFYTSETAAAHIPTVKLGRPKLAATYTIALLEKRQHARAAAAFVSFLLGARGSALLRHHGIVVVRPRIVGPVRALPGTLRRILRARRALHVP